MNANAYARKLSSLKLIPWWVVAFAVLAPAFYVALSALVVVIPDPIEHCPK